MLKCSATIQFKKINLNKNMQLLYGKRTIVYKLDSTIFFHKNNKLSLLFWYLVKTYNIHNLFKLPKTFQFPMIKYFKTTY